MVHSLKTSFRSDAAACLPSALLLLVLSRVRFVSAMCLVVGYNFRCRSDLGRHLESFAMLWPSVGQAVPRSCTSPPSQNSSIIRTAGEFGRELIGTGSCCRRWHPFSSGQCRPLVEARNVVAAGRGRNRNRSAAKAGSSDRIQMSSLPNRFTSNLPSCLLGGEDGGWWC